MPLRELSVLDQREAFVKLCPGERREPESELCRELGISRKAGYQWLLGGDRAGGRRRMLGDRLASSAREPIADG